ncbi:FecR family protein [Maribacter sp. ACAM166]|uniref:FecR family protein n=1 Tax=Maribacter sp. ACAM166 TaxID=2508996 RepID=UPI0010FF1329|nr:FecR family protein [Maribacter sp. ACAM166]TLP71842.1 DUF4974 domain-containing protein [Maribacter sp. ACAM166]
MNKKKAKKLFDKYVNKQCTPEEVKLLDAYLESYQNRENIWSKQGYLNEDKERVWSQILDNIAPANTNKSSRLDIKRCLKYAAIFIIALFGLAFYFSNQPIQETHKIAVDDASIILKTANNILTSINVEEEKEFLDKTGTVVGKQNNGLLKYTTNSALKEEIYNEIIVPNGKTFKLVLSDGSKVHLNAGSSLRFPINFIENNNRQVFLKGEAFFDVTKNEESPFLVNAEGINVEVLGTQFSVNAYIGIEPYTVLQKGSVAVSNTSNSATNKIVIKPGQMAVSNADNIAITAVDIDDYLGWVNGVLIFNNETFVNIINKIERQYGVHITNNYLALNPIKFNGTFKDESIVDLLDTFKESVGFDYKITNNEIIIIQK